MIKHRELTDPQSCLNKAGDDEPVFVLRAQDKLAPMVVRQWLLLAKRNGLVDPLKIEHAEAIANQMDEWPTRKYPD